MTQSTSISTTSLNSICKIKPLGIKQKSIEELEKECMKYEYLLQRHMNIWERNPSVNKENLKIAIRASKEAHKRWKKIAYLIRITSDHFWFS